MSVLVNDSNNVTLQVLYEIIWGIVIKNTTNTFFIVVDRNKRIGSPRFTQDFCALKSIGVLYAPYCLARSDTIGIVGIGITVKRLQLSALFPCQRMTEILDGVALLVVGNGLAVKSGKQVFPNCIAVGVRLASLFDNVSIIIIHHCVDNYSIFCFSQKLSECIVGVCGCAINAVGYFGNSFFCVILIRQRSSV